MIFARQSTAIIVTVGPVLDANGVAVTDGVVGDFLISKNGAAPAALNASATLTHRNTGHYSLSLTATDVNTVGTAEIVINDTTNACPIKEITVIEPATYDVLFSDAAPGPASPTNITAAAGCAVSSLGANVITAAATAADFGTEVAAAVWQDAVAGDFTVASSIGKALYVSNVAPGAAGGHFIAGTNAATTITTSLTTTFTGNLTGSVASVTAGVTLAASAVQAIWDALTSALTTVGSIGKLIVDNLDAAISSRMATYTQPTGFLAATFPSGTIANTTNITAGTVTTATNVTTVNGLAANVITAASIAADAITDAKVASDVTIASVTGAVGSVTGAVGSVTGNVGGNVTGTIGGLTAAALADFFDTDSTTTYASAVAGSVVKEIADNAGGSSVTAADIADAVWDEDATAHQTQGSFGQAIGDPAADANTIYGAVVTGAAGATVAADIIAVKAETASILTDTAEIGAAGAGLTAIDLPDQTMNITGNLSGSVGSVTGLTASDVGAIKTKTDSLTFTVPNVLDANVQAINDVTVTGDGSGGTPWGP